MNTFCAAYRIQILIAVLPLAMGLGCHSAEVNRSVRTSPESLSAMCASFQSLRAGVSYPGLTGNPVRFLVYVKADGNVVADRLASRGHRFAYIEGETWWDMTGYNQPERHSEADEVMADIFRECRSGFEDSRWRRIHPWEEGLIESQRELDWWMLVMPFQWADDMQFYLGFDPHGNHHLRYMWISRPGRDAMRIRVAGLEIDGQLSDDLLYPLCEQ